MKNMISFSLAISSQKLLKVILLNKSKCSVQVHSLFASHPEVF